MGDSPIKEDRGRCETLVTPAREGSPSGAEGDWESGGPGMVAEGEGQAISARARDR